MNKKYRQRAPRLKPTIKRLIVGDAVQYPKKPRLALAAELKDKIERLGEISPSEETLMKMISDARNRNPSALDEPWHLGLMGKPEYDITPEAVPYILMVKAWAEQSLNVFKQQHGPITARQALWISRLYGFTEYVRRRDPKWDFEFFLFQWSEAYSCRERVCELSNTPFDTSRFDNGVINRGLPITAGASTIIRYPDSSLELDTLDKDLLRQVEEAAENGKGAFVWQVQVEEIKQEGEK